MGLFFAAAASVATSAPEPDWTLEDTASGEITIAPDVEGTSFKLRVTSEVVQSRLDMAYELDPEPKRGVNQVETPIVLFVSSPLEIGSSAPTSLEALPTGYADPNGFERAGSATVPPQTGARELEVRVRWKSPNSADYIGGGTYANTSSSGSVSLTSPREVAERRPTKLRWHATISAEGYDDRPRGAKVDVDDVPGQ